IERLRAGHRVAGVQPQHYGLMRQAILNSVGTMLGDKFDERTAEAWGAAFDTLAETMQKPESATPEEIKLLSSMFGRKLENTSSSNAGGATLDEFFDKK
ncbi:MAG: globin domain-containing protein, partial [Rhodomicrobium sp.]